MQARKSAMKKICLLSLCLIAHLCAAQIPSGYYDGASGESGYTLKSTLHDIIDGHTTKSYSSVWTFVNANDLTDDGDIWDIYSDNPSGTPPYTFTPSTDQCGTYTSEGDCYNREHSFPKSWFSGTSPMNTDYHHMYPTDGFVNGRRDNYPLGEVGTATWTSQNGSKLGTSSISGYSGTVFEPIDEYKGDLARTYFYMATRYEDIIDGWSSDMLDRSTDQVYETWALEMLLSWHQADPVSQKEIDRNEAIYDEQGNRNPFIDHPEYVCQIWSCSGNNAPTFSSSAIITSTEDDTYSYSITTIDLDGEAVTISATTKPSWLTFTDNEDGTASLTGIPTSSEVGSHSIVLNVSDGMDNTDQYFTLVVSGVGSLPNAWINEIHYDNDGTDVGEFVEIIIEDTGFDLSLFTVTLYNGSGGAAYGTSTVDDYTLGETSGDFKVFYKDIANIQNGGPDGISLSYNGELIQFLSYEGSFNATDGVASGKTSTDISRSEPSSTPTGESVQLCCNGIAYSDMLWQSPATASKGNFNAGQVLPIELVSFEAIVKIYKVMLVWQTLTEINNETFVIEKSTNGRDFYTIGELAGSGTSSAARQYSFDDFNPQSINYYRLKQIDFDGKSSTSKTIMTRYQSSKVNEPTLYPIPVKDQLFITEMEPIESIDLFDLAGRPVDHQWSKQNDRTYTLDLSLIKIGTYVIIINHNYRQIIFKK